MQDNHHYSIEHANNEIIRRLKDSVAAGEPWHLALLEAIGRWTLAEESHNGQLYSYIVGGEAFDWLLLAQRLCLEIDTYIPEQEKDALLFHGRLPVDISEKRFRELIGEAKYRLHLNYFYGVTIEQFLQLAIEEEISRDRQARFLRKDEASLDDAYCRLYGQDEQTLLRRFRTERGEPQSDVIELPAWEEFAYWLFKYRLRRDEGALVASNTRKGLDYFIRQLQVRDVMSWGTSEGELLDLRCRGVGEDSDRRRASVSASV